MGNPTYMSPTLSDIQVTTDGVPIVQPKEILPSETLASPVIPDKDLSYLQKSSTYLTSNSPSQTIMGSIKFGGGWLIIDDANQRLIINDGKTDRILIGKY